MGQCVILTSLHQTAYTLDSCPCTFGWMTTLWRHVGGQHYSAYKLKPQSNICANFSNSPANNQVVELYFDMWIYTTNSSPHKSKCSVSPNPNKQVRFVNSRGIIRPSSRAVRSAVERRISGSSLDRVAAVVGSRLNISLNNKK
jgi:hypothetical protein